MELLFLLGLGLLFRAVTMEDIKADVHRIDDSLKLLTKRLDRMTVDLYSFESRLEIKMQSLFDEWKSAITSRQAPPEDVTHELELTQNMKTVIEESVQKQSAIVYRALSNEKWQIKKLKSDIQADITHFKAKTDAVVESLNSSVQLELTEIADKNAQSISSISSKISTNTNSLLTQSSRISELYAKRYFSAFHAQLSMDKDYSGYQTVVFDWVITNYGNDYDPSTGVYTAPVNGTYFLLFNIRCRNGKSSNVWSFINRNYMWTAGARCDDGGSSASGGVWHLNEGDRVWIKARFGDASMESYFTTFSGALLYVD